METTVISIIVSLVVSFLWNKWFMKKLENWMDRFFAKEEEHMKEFIDKSHKNYDQEE